MRQTRRAVTGAVAPPEASASTGRYGATSEPRARMPPSPPRDRPWGNTRDSRTECQGCSTQG
eukprot:8380608-Alexandrium_andersonii.AAC.1